MTASSKKRPGLGEARINQEAIGAGLRQMFEAVVNEPVPDEFLDLLRLADERPRGSENGPGDPK